MGKDARISHAFQKRSFSTRVGSCEQGKGLLVTLDGRGAEAVRDRVRVDTKQNMAAFIQPKTVVYKFWHNTTVVACPPGDGQPLVNLNEPTYGLLAMDLHGTELPGEVHQMIGLLRL